jgi:hypothetical protein
MNIPLLGEVTKDTEYDWYYSEPIPAPVLGGQACRIVIQGYDEDPKKDDFHAAIANFLSIDPSVLKAAETHIFDYYQECREACAEELVEIGSPSDVWRHVDLADEAMVSRRAHGDQGIYISLDCHCDWEEEHGLQIVFKNGQKVNKVGQYDGHLTNSDAYADETLENVVYRKF